MHLACARARVEKTVHTVHTVHKALFHAGSDVLTVFRNYSYCSYFLLRVYVSILFEMLFKKTGRPFNPSADRFIVRLVSDKIDRPLLDIAVQVILD